VTTQQRPTVDVVSNDNGCGLRTGIPPTACVCRLALGGPSPCLLSLLLLLLLLYLWVLATTCATTGRSQPTPLMVGHGRRC
jgi:hypothetical protein